MALKITNEQLKECLGEKEYADWEKEVAIDRALADKLRVPGVVYYFIDDPRHGQSYIYPETNRIWSDKGWNLKDVDNNLYHCIRKSRNGPYFEYFTFEYTGRHGFGEKLIEDDYVPEEFVKLVHFEDADKLGLKVQSEFGKIEQYARQNSSL